MQIAGTSSSGFVYSDTGGDGPAVVLLHGVLRGRLFQTRTSRGVVQ